MLYDGECSLCMKEVNFLRKRDAAAGKIDFVDIALPTYKAEDNAGISFREVSSQIKQLTPGVLALQRVMPLPSSAADSIWYACQLVNRPVMASSS